MSTARVWQLAPGLIVVGATLFNAVLAVINAHVMPMTSATVIASEALLVLGAHITAIVNYRPQMGRWYALVLILFAIAVIRGLLIGEFEPKLFRDALLIPTFIILGMTFDPRRLPVVVCTLVIIVAAFMLLEAVSTDGFARLFKIHDFYINTRGLTQDFFWNKESALFASATRADGRFINIVDLHRLSSIFLEPVGSETFCIIIWTYVCACYGELSRNVRIFLIAATLLMIVGTDGRLAFVLSGLIFLLCAVAQRLPSRLPFFYLPTVTMIAAIAVYWAGLQYDADNFSGRLAFSVHLLAVFDVADILGMSDRLLGPAGDAGLAYLILTQSLFGMMILWSFITLGPRQVTISQISYVQSTSLWIAMFMMVGAAFLTIKTAALLWFIYGSLQREGNVAVPMSDRRSQSTGSDRHWRRWVARPTATHRAGR